MARRSTPRHKLEAERLPFHVHVADVPGGLGHRLNDLLELCRRTYAPTDWFCYSASFYFATERMAERFRQACEQWGVDIE